MSDTRAGDRATFFLLGAAIGAATALLMAPASGAHTRRRLRRQGERVADYLIDEGKELVDKCEDLYERSGEVVEDATHELGLRRRVD
jgi:gas vesicle protein